MSVVNLVSGGLDSTVMAVLTRQEGLEQFPLFIDYGQLGKAKELGACRKNFDLLKLPSPTVASLAGYGELIRCGLTDRSKNIFDDAFLPCRNLLFLVTAASYAYQCRASTIGIGLLDERNSVFPDQTRSFIREAERLLCIALGHSVTVVAPLMSFSKADVLAIAKSLGVSNFYSCHAGTPDPCGICIACREYIGLEV